MTENLNPQEYKRQRDAGMAKPEPAPAAKAEKKPAAKKAAK